MKSRWVRTLGVVLVTTVLLAACGGAGAGDNGGNAPDFSGIEIFPMSFDAYSSMTNTPGAQALYLSGYYSAVSVQAYLLWALIDWSQTAPSTYTYFDGEVTYTIQWSQSGSTWCWTFFDGDSASEPNSVSVQICVTDTGTGWTIEVTDLILDFVWLEGTVAYDGSSGTVTLYSDSSFERYEIDWEPGTTPYAYSAEIRFTNSDGVYDSRLVIQTSSDGESGTWAYYNPPTATSAIPTRAW